MIYDTARQFWRAYIGIVNKDGADANMINPAVDFTVRAQNGEFDSLSDSEYGEKLDDVEDISTFWEDGKSETAGNILLNALAKTKLSDAEVDEISCVLADASRNTDYIAIKKEKQKCYEDIFNPDLDFSPEGRPAISASSHTPHNIYEYLNQHIYGQDAAKRAAAMLMWHHSHGNSRNIVMAGATGCGKTEIWRTLSRIYSCIRIVSGPQLSADGWKGSYHLKDIFWNEPKELARRLVIVIDEADKMAEPAIASGGMDVARLVQNELLKLMDGDTLTFVDDNNKGKKITVDCSGVSVVLCGSFERMLQEKSESSGSIGFCQSERKESRIAECTEEDLIQYANIRREIAGRINQIVTLETLDAEDFEAIMDSPASPIQKIEKAHKVSLYVDKNTRKKLASAAAESGLGCRYIHSKLQSLLDRQMFEKPDAEKYELYYE